MPKDTEGIVVRQGTSTDGGDMARILAGAGLCASGEASVRVTALLQLPLCHCVVAEKDGEMVGVAIAVFNGFHIFLSHIAVAHGWTRRGIGQMLHADLLKRGRLIGAKGIITDSWLSSTPFFWGLGYRIPGAVFLVRDIDANANA